MKRPVFVALFGFIMGFISFAQSERVVTLPMLYSALEQNSPISSIKNSLDTLSTLHIKNINSTYLPKIDFNAMASWQSDVTSINIPFPGISVPMPDADQYRVTVDIAQIIWDGGSTEARRNVAKSQLVVDKGLINNEIYAIRDRLNDAFFGIVLVDLTSKQLLLMREELNARLESLKSGVKEGLILPSVLLGLQAEILRLDQKILEMPARKSSLIRAINSITGLQITENHTFLLPEFNSESLHIGRPEIKSFEDQKMLLNARSAQSSKKRMPLVSSFVTSGYGKPGLNMLSNEWDTYLVIGARLTWNIWDWNATKREKEQFMVQQSIINFRKQAFEEGIDSYVKSTQNDIEVLSNQLVLDEKIVDMLQQVKHRSASQLQNGLISAAEFLSDFNAAARAQVDMEMRKVNLVKESVRLNFLLGKEID
jgi:outer membrane protein TolC